MRNTQIITRSVKAFTHLGYSLVAYRNKPEKLTKSAVKFRLYFESLGGIFIKFGQILALRVDIFPKEVCNELRNLLDAVPPFTLDTATKIIKADFGKEIAEIYDGFPEKPIASASLGQVYVAKLKDGNKVAVKILRPEVKEIAENDTNLIEKICTIVDHIPFFPIQISPVAREFKSWIFEEMDYTNEANNLREFKNYKSEVLPFFNIPLETNLPKVYDEFCSKNVLTMEFIEGITINKLIELIQENNEKKLTELWSQGYDLKTIVRNFNMTQMKQYFVDGYFNADPHPANLIVTPRNEIFYIDFGLVGKLSLKQKTSLWKFLRSTSLLDCDASYKAALSMFAVDDEKKRQKLKIALDKMFIYLRKQRVLKNSSYTKASTDSLLYFVKVLAQVRLELPIEIAKAFRSVMTGDGIMHNLAPDATVEEITQDSLRITLAATYLNIKKSMTQENTTKLMLKAINYLEDEMILSD